MTFGINSNKARCLSYRRATSGWACVRHRPARSSGVRATCLPALKCSYSKRTDRPEEAAISAGVAYGVVVEEVWTDRPTLKPCSQVRPLTLASVVSRQEPRRGTS